MTILLLILSALVGALALYPYIRDILKGRARPRIITWSIWAFLAGVMTVSALQTGEISSAVLSAQGFVGCSVIVLLGWRQGSQKIGRLDIASLAGAVVGLIALTLLQNPTVALVLSVAIDAIAFAPTLKHAWTDPDEEPLASYALNVGASSLAAVAAMAAGAGFVGLIYPIYSVLFNSIMTTLLAVSHRQLPEQDYRYADEDASV